ncbi:MAG: hypothetical protein AB7O26_11425 [Planctomycetaceae bacterium]
MRIVQIVLLIVGMTALGTLLGTLGIVFVISLLQAPTGEPWTRGFGQYIGGMVCGAPLGATLGLVFSIVFIRAQVSWDVWPLNVWGGIAVGVLAAIWTTFLWVDSGYEIVWLGLFLVLAFSTAGGLLGALIPLPRRGKKRK